jgi:predicted glycosyltransferase
VIEEFVPDLPSYLRAADVVVAMGGYNTVAELLALKRRALVLPRNWRYGEFAQGTSAGLEWEQLMRAEALQRLGLVRVLSGESFEPESLATSLVTTLHEARTDEIPDIAIDGAERAVDELISLLRPEERRVQA